jgi:hypothetical protein
MRPHTKAPLALLALALLTAQTTAVARQARPKAGAQTAEAPAPAGDVPAKIARLLDQSGMTYTKAGEGVWTMKFQGEALGEFGLFVATTPAPSELVVVGVVVASKAEFKPSQELFLNLLRFNGGADQVKVGVDDDGDIFLRAEVNGRLLDAREFKAVVEQVAAAANQVRGQNKSFFAARP